MNQKLNQIKSLISNRDYSKAKLLSNKFLKKYPKNKDILFLLGVIAYLEHDYPLAYKYLKISKSSTEYKISGDYYLAKCAMRLKKFNEAESAFQKSIAQNSHNKESWRELAWLYSAKQEYGKAEEAFIHLYRLDSKNINILMLIGGFYRDTQSFEKSEKFYKEALSIAKEIKDKILIRYGLARLYHTSNSNANLAMESLLPIVSELLTIDKVKFPLKSVIAGFIFNLKIQLNIWNGLDDLTHIIKEGIKEKKLGLDASSMLLSSEFSALDLRVCADINSHKTSSQFLTPLPKKEIDITLNRPIKVGFLSSDLLVEHPVYYVIIRALELLKQKGVTIFIYATRGGSKETQESICRVLNASEKLYNLEGKPARDIALTIANDQIDVLVDLNGHTKHNRYDVLLFRPVPIIVNWLGYPGTMGGDVHDYILGDRYVAPHTDQEFFSEKIWHLPHTYFPTDNTLQLDATPPKERYNLPKDKIIFASFSNSYKITPDVFDVWCKILILVPNSVLWLNKTKDLNQNRLMEEAERRGVSKESLIFAQRVESKKEHHTRLQLIDIGLDTWPYNMHTTCTDFLWSGVPVITLKGETFASRVAESILCAIDMPELVAKDKNEFVNIAVDLAKTPIKLKSFKERCWFGKKESILFNSNEMADNLKIAFLDMFYTKTGVRLKDN